MGTLAPHHIPPEIVTVCQRLRQAGFRAYVVGGAVRDHLRLPEGQARAKDFDLATSARPEDVIRVFSRKLTVPTGIQHGTVTVLVDRPGGAIHGHREHVEVTTFRGEGAYSDGRRPDQVFFIDDLREDLQRRDFTINAIAYDPIDDSIIDPFDGRADLSRGLIRAVGDAAARFGEDGLRTMRAVRFAAQLEFVLDPATAAAIPGALPTFRKVSGERVRDELLKLLAARRPSIGLRLMAESGLLREVLPELAVADEALFALFEKIDETLPDPILRLGALLSPLPPGVPPPLPRLKLSAKEQERLRLILSAGEIGYQSSWSAAQVRGLLATLPEGLLSDLEELNRARLVSAGRAGELAAPGGLAELFRRAAEERARKPPLSISALALSGQDVMTGLHIERGRLVGEVLRRLFQHVLLHPEENTREHLLPLMQKVHGELSGG